jgi:hypothetical protein
MSFNIGAEVFVYRKAPEMSYKGVILDVVDREGEAFYQIYPELTAEETLWIAENRLKLAPIYQCMDNWDGETDEKDKRDV